MKISSSIKKIIFLFLALGFVQPVLAVESLVSGLTDLSFSSAGTQITPNPAAPISAPTTILDMMPGDHKIAFQADSSMPQTVAEASVASGPKAQAPTILDQAKNGGVSGIRISLALVFVGSLIILAGLFFFKKDGVKIGAKVLAKSARVHQIISMGLKKQLLVVDFEGERLLIGLTASGFTTLSSQAKKDSLNSRNQEEAGSKILQAPASKEAPFEKKFEDEINPVVHSKAPVEATPSQASSKINRENVLSQIKALKEAAAKRLESSVKSQTFQPGLARGEKKGLQMDFASRLGGYLKKQQGLTKESKKESTVIDYSPQAGFSSEREFDNVV